MLLAGEVFVHVVVAQTNKDSVVHSVVQQLVERSSRSATTFIHMDKELQALHSAGIERAPELIPYFGRSDMEDCALIELMDKLESWDQSSMDAVETIAKRSRNVQLRSSATRVGLKHLPRGRAIECALVIVNSADANTLYSIMDWLSKQDPSWLQSETSAQQLAVHSCQRMTTVFDATSIRRNITFSLADAAGRFPFNQGICASNATVALLAILRHPHGLTDFDAAKSFQTLALVSSVEPRLVEAGLLDLVTLASIDSAKIVLWQIYADHCYETDSGKRVVAAALKKWPDLQNYVERLAAGAKNGRLDSEVWSQVIQILYH